MSSAKPTPRYVQRIPSPNIHLVGGATAEAQVIPIRRVTPAFVPVIEAPAAPVARPKRATRFVPVERRPWLVMLVPPTPGSRTRSFGVARWQAQLVAAALVVMLVVAGGAVATVVGAVDAPDLFGSTETDQLRERLELLEDSLTLARAQLATDDESVGDSLFDALPGAAIPLPADAAPAKSVATRVAARKPSSSRLARSSDENGIALAPRSLEGLPVIGRLASTFSRSRRHPVLHIRRPHLGVDIAAPRGTHIVAPAPGRVSFVGRKFGFGIVVEIDHGGGIRTRYAHLTKAMVEVGDEVGKGGFIATVGSTGITTGPHLHYEVLVNGRQVDPLRFRLPQPAESEGTAAAATGPAQPEAASVVPGAGMAAAPAPDSHEATVPAPAAPAP
jgi:murein DD-endopeptidase MepM/ murein hydrolase activator NlpD